MSRRHSRGRSRPSAPPADLIFGVNPVRELLRARADDLQVLLAVSGAKTVQTLMDDARRRGVAIELTDHATLDRLTQGGNHQGVAVRARAFGYVRFEALLAGRRPLLVAVDGVTDPQNLGAIIRSAEVLGAGGLFLPRDRACPVSPAVVRASAGGSIHLPVAQVVNLSRALAAAKEAGYWIVGLDPEGTQQFQDLPPLEQAVLVIGSEGKGTRRLVAEHCDFRVVIPVRGQVTSLNASVAAGIGLHELATRMPPGSKG